MRLDPSLHRIGNDTVAAYLITSPDGVTVIDAGLPGHWHELLKELAAVDRTVDDIRGVILTHGDSDHVGFAERLRRDHGVPVYVHELDADRAKGGPKPRTGKQKLRMKPALEFFGYALRMGGMRTTWLAEVVEIHDGQTLDLPGSPRIISLPGHSPGSIAVYSALVDAIFVGDGLTTRHVLTGEVGPQPAPFTDDPDEAISSLRNIVATGAKWVLPGHGAPWASGVVAAVASVESAARNTP